MVTQLSKKMKIVIDLHQKKADRTKNPSYYPQPSPTPPHKQEHF
jgi:hypothetical protein